MTRSTSSLSGPGATKAAIDDQWRQDNMGRLMSNALRHFEARVIELLAKTGHSEISPSHINATRHLAIEGTRLTDMARRAVMTKQSMSELVIQLEALGMVERRPDPLDGRARTVHFTSKGLRWLKDFGEAVRQAEKEMAREIGVDALRAAKAALRRYGPPIE